ncbi:MAG: hypothetical protein U9R14_02530 [Patescibacteria group bacterium]|nr:hypothetical protein [Patescibacteria group bacterium]
MKKIYLISIITVTCGLIFTANPYQLKFLWGFQVFLIPLTAGILMALVQDEDKSYNYASKLLIGSILTGFVYAFLFFIIDYIKYSEYSIKSFLETVDIISIIGFALPLIGICIFGGLIGITIRGVSLLLSKK